MLHASENYAGYLQSRQKPKESCTRQGVQCTILFEIQKTSFSGIVDEDYDDGFVVATG
jgi:hypothetical protein